MKLILLSIFYLIFPYLIIRLSKKIRFLEKIGTVVLCFIFGLILSFSGLLPEGSEEIQDVFISLSIVLALPMLLFGTDLNSWKSIAGKTLLSFFTGLISLIIIVCVGYLIWNQKIDDADKIGGMMVGLYTGGTPNLAALQTALKVSPEVYLMVNTYDLFYGAVYLLSIMSFGKLFLAKILPKFRIQKNNSSKTNVKAENINDNPFEKSNIKQLILSLLLALLIGALSAGVSFLITGEISMLILVLSLTSFSLIAGLIKPVKKLEVSFNFGMYFILIFSITLASMVKPELLLDISYNLFWYIGFTIFGTLFLHIIFAIILRIDRDTTIVTSTSLICSPPFVPMMAGVLKNKNVILPGITVGIIGYAVGNYLGVLLSWFLQNYL